MVTIAMPTIGNMRYRPVRVMIWPAVIDAASMPPMRGASSRPESLAEAPLATWRNVGR